MSLFFSEPASCTRSGWRKSAVVHHPIARGEPNHSTKTDRHCRCGFRSHGGLTPAALVNERWCIAQVAVSSANARTAKPPRAGGVSSPWHVSILVRQERLGAAGAIPEPRRADTRRSCERAFVHPECRYFSADRHRAPGAAGVSQPWATIGWRVVNVITRRKRIAIAGAVAEPRRADGSPMLVRRPLLAENCSLCPAGAIRFRTTAGSRPPLLMRRSSFPEHYSPRSASATRYRTTAG
jgi:hypothetical protein